jgi:ribosomal protein L13
MPAWLLPLLLKYVLPAVIQWLQKEGYIDAAEALLGRGAVTVAKEITSLRTYSEPTDFPDSPPQDTGNLRR